MCVWLTGRLISAEHVTWFLVVPTVMIELYLLSRLLVLTATAGGRPRRMSPALSDADAADIAGATGVAVIATTEALPMVRRAVIAAIDGTNRDRVVLVGASPELSALADEFGISFGRSEGSWSSGVHKALRVTRCSYLALLPASTVMIRRSVTSVARYFDDGCAWVQAATTAPLERTALQHLQQLRVGPTIDQWDGTPCTGSGAVVDVAAFSVVDVTAGSLATSVQLQAAGWHGRLAPQMLAMAQGDQPIAARERAESDHAAHRLHALVTRHSPLWARHLTWRQRVAHVSTLLDDIAGAVCALVAVVATASLVVGKVPIAVDSWFLFVGIPAHLLVIGARFLLSGGLLRPGTLAHANADAISPSIRAIARAWRRPSAPPVALTVEQSGVAAVRHRPVTMVLALALEAALLARAISAITGHGVPDRSKSVDIVLLAFGVAVLVPMLASLRVIIRARHLRATHRASTSIEAMVEGRRARVIDLSADGLGLAVDGDRDLGKPVVEVRLLPTDGDPIDVVAAVVRSRPGKRSVVVGLHLVDGGGARALDGYVRLWLATATAPAPRQQDRPAARPQRMPVRAGGNPFVRVATAATLLMVGIANLPPYGASFAAPPPGALTLSKSAPSEVLYGANGGYDLSTCNTLGSARYNLSLRDVLPAGASFVDGSPSPTKVLANSPSTGFTTLLWENISDLQNGSCFGVHYNVSHNAVSADTGTLRVGSTVTNNAGAYVQTDPRTVPKFSTTGVPTTGSFIESATATANSLIVPITIAKSEPSPEDELVRGVHQHSTVYTLTVTNNTIKPTNAVTVDDWLPAGLEFLGCGTVDNTPGGAVEYPGAPRLDVSTPDLTTNCATPTLVETVSVDPDGTGPLATAVYTHVQWAVGDMKAAGVATIQYRAGIPNRENQLFPAVIPPATKPPTTANLSNNTGALTTEPANERSYTNLAAVSGTYPGSIVGSSPATRQWDTATETVFSEDLAIQKSACNATNPNPQQPSSGECLNGVTYGGETTWRLRLATGEYRSVSDIVLTDTLGDGLEYVAASARLTNGVTTVSVEPTAVVQSDGTQLLTWTFNSLLTAGVTASMAPDATYVVTFVSRTLSDYRATKQPILSFDRLNNTTSVSGTSAVVRGDDTSGTIRVGDVSSASIGSSWSTIDKRTLSGADASAAPGTLGCSTGTVPSITDVVPRFAPNEVICFSLSVTFPTGIRVRDAVLTDFIPPNSTYVGYAPYPDSAAGYEKLTAGTVGSGSAVQWAFGVNPTAVPRYTSDKGDVFHVVVAVRASDEPAANNNYDLVENLFKATGSASNGSSVSLRDIDSYRIVEPELQLVKGVIDIKRAGTSITGYPKTAPASGTDSHTVRQNDVVTYRINAKNIAPQFADPAAPTVARVDGSGRQVGDATNVVVWDVLPIGLSCAQLTPATIASNVTFSLVRTGTLALAAAPTPSITGLSCDDTTNRISFTAASIPAGYTLQADYVLTVSAVAAAAKSFTDTAGVRTYNDIGGG
ncbi:MAG: hypothetical protein RLZZ623_3426, partial [Actinomycetota bacterium]